MPYRVSNKNPFKTLNHTLPLKLPAFERWWREGDDTYSAVEDSCEVQFSSFIDRLIEAKKSRRFLPICRMSDGEFTFLLGHQRLTSKWSVRKRIRADLGMAIRRLRRSTLLAGTRHYRSGSYSRAEWGQSQEEYGGNIKAISEKGVLALHLSFGAIPFQEHFFEPLQEWMTRKKVSLGANNYVPFYFVYAALTGPRRGELFEDARVLVVNSASGSKQANIVAGLRANGAREVHWLPISGDRSLFDTIDPTPFVNRVDLVVVGAGVGKPNILLQLEPLGVPCLDAGFVFEVWADRSQGIHRAYCLPDFGAQ
jgi:hypothetical protein